VDQVRVTLTVEIVRPDAGEAFREAGTRVTGVLAVLADHGVDARSVRTADLSLAPRYDYRAEQSVLTGHAATQELVVILDGLSRIDTLLTDLVHRCAEGLRIESLRLVAENPREAAADARTAAMIDAREQATSLALLAGRPLGPVVRITDQPSAERAPVALMAHGPRDAAAGPMPVASGDTSVTVSLAVHFAWAD
jgi:uncharacterized protein YggE